MLVCVYRDGRGPGGVQATNSFDKSIMGKISKIGKAMKMSKAKSRDLMSFAALKKKLVIESGTDALNLKYVRPPSGCSPLVHGGSCVLSRGVLVCVCCACSRLPFDERAVLEENRAYIIATLGASSVTVFDASDPSIPDPGRRAASAVPNHPGLYVAMASDVKGQ